VKATLLGFLEVARNAGISVSNAESIDAFNALALVGYDDRLTVKDSLGLVLAKTAEERRRFDACFDRYFDVGKLDAAQRASDSEALEPAESRPESEDGTLPSLERILLDDDRASLVRLLYASAAAVDLAAIRLFTQAGFYARRILEAMGIVGLEASIARMRSSGVAGEARTADDLELRRDAVRELAKDLVERRLALRGEEPQGVRDRFLLDARLTNVDRRDVERMRVLVRDIARRLAIHHGRTRKHARRGHLDMRHTMRRNVAYDGVAFKIAWKKRKIEKPRLVVLCDVSGSMASLAHFLLLFVHCLNEALADLRAFAFANRTIEVTEILRDDSIDVATKKIMAELGFRSSDYGRSFEDFENDWIDAVDRKTTVVILGDARTNYGDPRVDVLRRLFERCKRLVWLNPENRVAWGADDSAMLRYLPYCHMASVCNRLRHLERLATDLLGITQPRPASVEL
jgi:uncharacterized protein with von Willebrand factor type A (vWA) domain